MVKYLKNRTATAFANSTASSKTEERSGRIAGHPKEKSSGHRPKLFPFVSIAGQIPSTAASNCASVVGEKVIGTFMSSEMVTVVNDE